MREKKATDFTVAGCCLWNGRLIFRRSSGAYRQRICGCCQSEWEPGHVSCRHFSYTYVPAHLDDTVYADLFTVKHVPEWVPGAGFQKTARYYREFVDKTVDTILTVKENMVRIDDKLWFICAPIRFEWQVKGTYRTSLASQYLEELDEVPDRVAQEHAIRGLAATIYSGKRFYNHL